MSDFDELLRSPLDDRAPSRGYGALIGGVLLGAIAVGGLLVLLQPEDAEPTLPTAAPTTITSLAPTTSLPRASTTTTVAEAPPPRFAEGYVAVADDVAWKASGLVETESGFVIAVTAAVAADADPSTTPRPMGGAFRIERADGSIVPGERIITDRFHPGSFGVEFSGSPAPGDTLRAVERWDPAGAEHVVSVPYLDDAPFVMPEPASIPVGQGSTLVISSLELGRFLGSVEWALEGPDGMLGVAGLSILLVDGAGEEIGDYAGPSGSLDAVTAADAVQLFWGPSFPTDQTGATDTRITVRLQLGERTTVETALPLDHLIS